MRIYIRTCIFVPYIIYEYVVGLDFHFESCYLLNYWVIGQIVYTLIWVFNIVRIFCLVCVIRD
jgi:hypothetical protein